MDMYEWFCAVRAEHPDFTVREAVEVWRMKTRAPSGLRVEAQAIAWESLTLQDVQRFLQATKRIETVTQDSIWEYVGPYRAALGRSPTAVLKLVKKSLPSGWNAAVCTEKAARALPVGCVHVATARGGRRIYAYPEK